MTRKHFEAIARCFRDQYEYIDELQHEEGPGIAARAVLWSLAVEISRVLATTNPNFDRERFLAACRKED